MSNLDWNLKFEICFWWLLDLLGREGSGTPLQYSCLENPVDGGAWWAAVHGVAKSWTWLSYFSFTFHFHALEKEMATHFSVLAWRIPGMGKPGGLLSVWSHRVGHDWSDFSNSSSSSSNWLHPAKSLFRIMCYSLHSVTYIEMLLHLTVHPNWKHRFFKREPF